MRNVIRDLCAAVGMCCVPQVIAEQPHGDHPESLPDQGPRVIQIGIQIFDVPATDTREILESTVRVAEHSSLLQQLTERAEAGTAQLVTHGQLTVRSGTLAGLRLTESMDHPVIQWNKDGKDFTIESGRTEYGTVLRCEALVWPEWDYVDARYKIEHDIRKPQVRTVELLSAKDKLLKPQVLQRYKNTIQSESAIPDGGALLVANFTYPGLDLDDPLTLRLVFLSVDLPLPTKPRKYTEQAAAGDGAEVPD